MLEQLEQLARGLTTWQGFLAALGGLIAVIGGIFVKPASFWVRRVVNREIRQTIEPRVTELERGMIELRAAMQERARRVDAGFVDVTDKLAEVRGLLESVSNDVREVSGDVVGWQDNVGTRIKQAEQRLHILETKQWRHNGTK